MFSLGRLWGSILLSVPEKSLEELGNSLMILCGQPFAGKFSMMKCWCLGGQKFGQKLGLVRVDTLVLTYLDMWHVRHHLIRFFFVIYLLVLLSIYLKIFDIPANSITLLTHNLFTHPCLFSRLRDKFLSAFIPTFSSKNLTRLTPRSATIKTMESFWTYLCGNSWRHPCPKKVLYTSNN